MIFLGNYKELCPSHDFPSMSDSFSATPYEGQGKIIHYLRNCDQDMCRMSGAKDVFTGEVICNSLIGRNDGEYSWFEDLAYYVEHYNLRLPQEFENKVLKLN